MNESVLFLGQCKQGSNSLFKVLKETQGLTVGNDIRAMVRTHNAKKDYISNWEGINLEGTKYLLDKSIVNPKKYNYKVLGWQNYQHKMIYMIRNIHDVLKSQFLIVLAGEESYQYEKAKCSVCWELDNFTTDIAELVMDYNRQKFTHFENLQNLDKDVFDPKKNIFFTTFENFIDDAKSEFSRLSEFIGIPIQHDFYPVVNVTRDWYDDDQEKFEHNVKLFEDNKDYIYNLCIDYEEWEKLSEYFDNDLIQKYDIKRRY